MSKVKLGEVAREYKVNVKAQTGKEKLVGLEHLDPQEVVLSNWTEGVTNSFRKTFKKGHVLFGRRRAYLKKAAYAHFDGICSGDITVIEAKKDKIEERLLPFIVQNDKLFDYAIGKSAGLLSPRVKWEYLKNYEFNLPSMEEQKELAEILWAAEELKQKYEKAAKELSALKIKMIAEITKQYDKKVKLKKIIKVLEKSNIKAGDGKDKGKYKFYTCGKNIKRIDEFLVEEEVLLCSTGGVYIVHYSDEPCSYSTDVYAISAKEGYLTKYLFEILNNIGEEQKDILFKGTGLKHLDKNRFLDIDIPDIDIDEQNSVIDQMNIYEEEYCKIINLIEAVDEIKNKIINGEK